MFKKAFRPLLIVLAGLLALGAIYLAWPRSFHGRIVDAETGQALAGVPVAVGAQEVTTDAQGNFTLQGLRGWPKLSAAAPGYTLAISSVLAVGLPGGSGTITLKLEPVTLRGAVTDAETSKPLADATVRAGDLEARTDAQGRYTLKRVQEGVTITAEARYHAQAEPVQYKGQATQDFALPMGPAVIVVRNLYSEEPLAGATVTAGDQTQQTNERGEASFDNLPAQTEISATLKGYAEARGKAEPGDTTTLDLRPSTLRGAVTSAEGKPLAQTLVLAQAQGQEPRLTYTNDQGEYELQDVPVDATLVVRRAGYKRLTRQLGKETGLDFKLEPFVAKGIYLSSGVLMKGQEPLLQENLDLIDKTELNTVVFEVKTDEGHLVWSPKLKLAQELDAELDNVMDIHQVLQECQKRNIYTIARMVMFKDHVLGTARPQWAVKKNNGGLWLDSIGTAWMDPFQKDVWDYNIALINEVADLGFDEIQLDYIRFPSDGDIMDTNYIQECTRANRVQAVVDFVKYARQDLDKRGIFFSVDLFGLTTSVDLELKFGDLGIGQQLADVAPYVDYISPMVYPSIYIPGNLGLRDPQNSPYDVVKISVADGVERGAPTLLRPWLQYNSSGGVPYGPPEFRLEKQAAEEAGATGWLFWNIWGTYDLESFNVE